MFDHDPPQLFWESTQCTYDMLANLQIRNLFVCLSTSFEKSYRGPYSFWKALDLKKSH